MCSTQAYSLSYLLCMPTYRSNVCTVSLVSAWKLVIDVTMDLTGEFL